MQTWSVELTVEGQSLAEVKIQRGIFQGDALSPLLFVIAMMLWRYILRKCTARCKLSKSQEKFNHLLYMDDIKIFTKNEEELETLIPTARIFNQGIEFSVQKCCMRVMKSDKRRITKGVEPPNQIIRTFGEKETYKCLGILESGTIKQKEIGEKKSLSEESENYLSEYSIAGILSKG